MTVAQARKRAAEADQVLETAFDKMEQQIAVKSEHLASLTSLVNALGRFNEMEWPAELVGRAQRLAQAANRPMEQFLRSLVREAMNQHEGLTHAISIDGEIFQRIQSLAEGRNCSVEVITQDDNFTEWLRQGLDNMRF